MNVYLEKAAEIIEKRASSVTAVSALRRLAQKKKKNPILDKAFQKAHAKAKIYK